MMLSSVIHKTDEYKFFESSRMNGKDWILGISRTLPSQLRCCWCLLMPVDACWCLLMKWNTTRRVGPCNKQKNHDQQQKNHVQPQPQTYVARNLIIIIILFFTVSLFLFLLSHQSTNKDTMKSQYPKVL